MGPLMFCQPPSERERRRRREKLRKALDAPARNKMIDPDQNDEERAKVEKKQ